MRFPLLPVAAAYAAGLALWKDVADSPQILLALSLAALLAGALFLWRDHRRVSVALALSGFFLLGGATIRFEELTVPAVRIDRFAEHNLNLDFAVRVRGWVRTTPVERFRVTSFELEAEFIEQGEINSETSGGIRVTYSPQENDPPFEALPRLAYGDRIEVLLTLRKPKRFRNAGSFDWPGQMARRGIFWNATLRSGLLIERRPGIPGSAFVRQAQRLRSTLLHRLDLQVPPGRARAVLHAMLLGDRSLLSRGLAEEFRLSGGFHVLVISGLHVGLIALALFWLLRLVRANEWVIAPLVIFLLVVYLFMVEDRAPTERAVWMISLYLVSRLFFRDVHLANPAGLAGLLMLLFHPLWLFDASFHFTFSAVLLMAFFGLPWIQRTSEPYRKALSFLSSEPHDDRMPAARLSQFRLDLRALAALAAPLFFWSGDGEQAARTAIAWGVRVALRAWDFFVLSFAIHLGFLVLIPFVFNRMVWSGLIASMLTIPLVMWIVPLGLAALVTPVLGKALGSAAALLTGLVILFVGWLADLPLNYWLPPPPLWLLLLYLASLVWFARATHRRRGEILAAGVLLPLMILVATHPFPARVPHQGIEVTVLDVGQGDSIFLAFPSGETWLVDGGAGPRKIPSADTGELQGEPAYRGYDIGRTVVGQFLRDRRVKRLDRIWLTHLHHDHASGLERVLEEFEVGSMEVSWPSLLPSRTAPVLELAREKRIPVRSHKGGEVLREGPVRVEVLWPPADYKPSPKKKDFNDDSLVLRICLDDNCILLPGDIKPETERRLARITPSLRAEAVKVPHHGGLGSATEEFLRAVDPRIAILSAGGNSPHGHPREETLKRLDRFRVKSYRTDRDGSVTLHMTAEDISVSTFQQKELPVPVRNVGERLSRFVRDVFDF